MRIEIKRVVAGTERVTPYFWASGGNFEEFEAALRDDETIAVILTVEKQEGDERFYRVTWEANVENLMTGISDAKATVLEAVSGGGEGWELKVFPSRGALSARLRRGHRNLLGNTLVHDESLTGTVVAAVRSAADSDPRELPPLYDAIDSDALEDIFATMPGSTERRLDGRVVFLYGDYEVCVESGGTVRVYR